MALVNLGYYGDVEKCKWPWLNFTPYEMRSDHNDDGNIVIIDPEFMDLLEKLRFDYDRPMPVTSYYRSPAYNAKVAKSGRLGPHTTGRAVDIRVSGFETAVLTGAAVALGFKGFGWKQKGNSRFLHLDTLKPRSWSY